MFFRKSNNGIALNSFVLVTCRNNLVFQQCGSPCDRTCENRNPFCTQQCSPRCVCPNARPILHNERFVAK